MNISFFAEKTNMVRPKFLNWKTKLKPSLVHYNVSIISKKTNSHRIESYQITPQIIDSPNTLDHREDHFLTKDALPEGWKVLHQRNTYLHLQWSPQPSSEKIHNKMVQNLIDIGAANTQKFKRRSAANI